MHTILQIEKRFSQMLLGLSAMILAAILVCIFSQVIFRYVLSSPLPWSEELARFLFVWLTMITAAGSMSYIMNQNIDLFTSRLSDLGKKIVFLFGRFIVLFVGLVLVRHGVDFVVMNHTQTSSSMGIPMSFVYSAIPIGASLMIVAVMLDILKHLMVTNERSNKLV